MSVESTSTAPPVDDWCAAKLVLSSLAVVVGGVGCFAVYQHFRIKKIVHRDRKRTLAADKNIMRVLKKSSETGTFLGGTAIEG